MVKPAHDLSSSVQMQLQFLITKTPPTRVAAPSGTFIWMGTHGGSARAAHVPSSIPAASLSPFIRTAPSDPAPFAFGAAALVAVDCGATWPPVESDLEGAALTCSLKCSRVAHCKFQT